MSKKVETFCGFFYTKFSRFNKIKTMTLIKKIETHFSLLKKIYEKNEISNLLHAPTYAVSLCDFYMFYIDAKSLNSANKWYRIHAVELIRYIMIQNIPPRHQNRLYLLLSILNYPCIYFLVQSKNLSGNKPGH